MQPLNHHCKGNNIVPHRQSTYKEYNSCETALLKFVNDALRCMERKEVLLLISLDLSVAFDSVDHAVLLKVLHNYFGVGEISLKWFKSYLDNRYFKVCKGTSCLSLKKLLFSIPQGSCRGPGLCDCYLATIVEIIPCDIDMNVFTDDHALETSFKPDVAILIIRLLWPVLPMEHTYHNQSWVNSRGHLLCI